MFVEEVRDVVGLSLSPPERARVLCVDEKSPIPAWDRSQPFLPMRPGQGERRPHDHTRHGTTSLFAAHDITSGAAIGRGYPQHRSSEFSKFLDQIETNIPGDLDVHFVMDNYASNKTKPIRDWLAKRPRRGKTPPKELRWPVAAVLMASSQRRHVARDSGRARPRDSLAVLPLCRRLGDASALPATIAKGVICGLKHSSAVMGGSGWARPYVRPVLVRPQPLAMVGARLRARRHSPGRACGARDYAVLPELP